MRPTKQDLVTNKAAIVGAGLAGLSCARRLRRAGYSVEVFEQDRVIGGRAATTRVGPDTFDHGAQYLTARSEAFRGYLSEISELGYAGLWSPRASLVEAEGGAQLHPWFVGTPGMSSVARPMAESVRVSTGRRVHALERREKGWHVWFEDETSVGPFHAVAVAVPAVEAQQLLARVEALTEPLSRVRMAPCWALMVRLEEAILPGLDVFSDLSGAIRWIARNNTKPGRVHAGESIVIHASSAWSRANEDLDPEDVAEELWGEVSNVLNLPPVRPSHMTAHLWRQGTVDQSLGESCLYSSEWKAGIAGDWCLGRLAEHAFESGDRLGRAIIDSLN